MIATIIDYGLGNLYSLKRALNYLGSETKITENPEEISDAELLILPGVGAFGEGIENLNTKGLIEPLKSYADSNRPLMGICLGMQLLLSTSEEMGTYDGLDIIGGKVLDFTRFIDNHKYKIPYVAWGELKAPSKTSWHGTVLEDVEKGGSTYFVHSFVCVPDDRNHILATTKYGNYDFASVVKKGNIYGCQFHPETSGEVGLRILNSFLNINR